MDPAEAKRLLPFKPCDQTSNQRLVYEQMVSPENRDMFLKTVKELKEHGWEAILDRMVSTVFLDSSLLFGGLTDDVVDIDRVRFCVRKISKTCRVECCCNPQPSMHTILKR